jgi:hypothetical protein
MYNTEEPLRVHIGIPGGHRPFFHFCRNGGPHGTRSFSHFAIFSLDWSNQAFYSIAFHAMYDINTNDNTCQTQIANCNEWHKMES